jgi:hypothetical protein
VAASENPSAAAVIPRNLINVPAKTQIGPFSTPKQSLAACDRDREKCPEAVTRPACATSGADDYLPLYPSEIGSVGW